VATEAVVIHESSGENEGGAALQDEGAPVILSMINDYLLLHKNAIFKRKHHRSYRVPGITIQAKGK
jgi:hypothetical protein